LLSNRRTAAVAVAAGHGIEFDELEDVRIRWTMEMEKRVESS